MYTVHCMLYTYNIYCRQTFLSKFNSLLIFLIMVSRKPHIYLCGNNIPLLDVADRVWIALMIWPIYYIKTLKIKSFNIMYSIRAGVSSQRKFRYTVDDERGGHFILCIIYMLDIYILINKYIRCTIRIQ